MSINTNEQPPQVAAIGSAEHNRVVASRWIGAFNARDDAAEVASRTADYVAHAPESIEPAALDSNAWIEFLEGFPDLHIEVLDSSADDRMVAQRMLFTGTHTGPFRGLPATGHEVRFSALEINRMADGRVAEHWFQLDAVTLFEQLGLRIVPGPGLLARLLVSPVERLLGKRRRRAGVVASADGACHAPQPLPGRPGALAETRSRCSAPAGCGCGRGAAQRRSLMRIRLPAGSRKAQSRTPYGCSIGSWTTSAPVPCSRVKVASRSGVARTMWA